jgi:Holliday junction DNA helicase RuvA
MIARLEGTVHSCEPGALILSVGGVSYRVFTTFETIEKVNDQLATVALWTHLAVRDNAMDLYGFLSREELSFFELLISVPRIGPRSALAILNVADTQTIKKAVLAGDSSYLTKVSGIGKKNAEKIVIELSGKLDFLGEPDTEQALQGHTDAIDALTALGYSRAQAREALKNLSPDLTDTGDRVRAALKNLSR